MSQHVTHDHELEVAVGERAMPLKNAKALALLVGLIATILMVVATFLPDYRQAALGSYVFGWYFTMTIVLGMLGLLILHHTLRASWSLPLLKLLQAGASPAALGVMLVLFLPVLLQPGAIYEWVNPGNDHLLQKKVWWLNQTWWTIRTVIYFAIFAGMSGFLTGSVRRQEAGAPDGFKLEMGRSSWGAFFIVVFILTITFASTDWVMSLEPHWYSTMYPVWQMVAACLGAGGLVVAILSINARKAPYNTVVGPNVTRDWGNILFMFTMLWAYTAVSQFLIIWNGNLPETAVYFARRGRMGWNAIGMMTILGQFLVPWMVLLSPRIKRYPHLLRGVAGWIVVMHFVDVYHAVVPALPLGGFHGGGRSAISFPGIFLDLVATIGIGGLWFFMFAKGVTEEKNLLPTYDHRLQEALVHAH